MKICPVCRTENSDNAMFCVKCGEPLLNKPVEKDAPAFPEEEMKTRGVSPEIPKAVFAATSANEGKPIIVPKMEEKIPSETSRELEESDEVGEKNKEDKKGKKDEEDIEDIYKLE